MAKAREYALRPELVTIERLQARFHGNNQEHHVAFDGRWTCDCEFFGSWQTCAHVLAVERMLAPMLNAGAGLQSGQN